MNEPDTMTRSEREDLARVIRLRAKVTKASLDTLAADRRAEVEAQLSAVHQADDERWRVITVDADRLVREADASEAEADEKAVVVIEPPLPPGCMTTIWGDDERFVKTYFSTFSEKLVYSTFDWGIRDQEGYYFILGRTDDVINVAGHRLGTREIEEAIQAHSNVAEVAVVGVNDALKGQMPLAFAVLKDASRAATPEARAAEEKAVMAVVDSQLGAIARPSRVRT